MIIVFSFGENILFVTAPKHVNRTHHRALLFSIQMYEEVILRASHQTGGRRSAQRAQVICTRSIIYAYVYVCSVCVQRNQHYQIQVAWRALCYMKRTQP